MERQHCCLHQWSKKPVRQYRGCGCSCNHQLSESLSKTEWCNLSYRTASPETWQWGPRWGGRSARSNRSFSFGLRSFSGGCLPNFFFVIIIIVVEGCLSWSCWGSICVQFFFWIGIKQGYIGEEENPSWEGAKGLKYFIPTLLAVIYWLLWLNI